jgi:hypothetical protein
MNQEIMIMAAKSEHIGSIDKMQRLEMLATEVSSCFTKKGQTPAAEDITVISSELDKFLSLEIPSMTIPEVSIALDSGVYGEYGEYFGINAVTLVLWCKAYFSSPERKAAISAEFGKRRQILPTLSEESLEKINDAAGQRLAVESWNCFRDTGKLPEYITGTHIHSIVYDYLRRRGSITAPGTNELKATELKAKSIIRNTRKNAWIRDAMNETISNSKVGGIADECKRILLFNFFCRKVDEIRDQDKRKVI